MIAMATRAPLAKIFGVDEQIAMLEGLLPVAPARVLLLGHKTEARASILISMGYHVSTCAYSQCLEVVQCATVTRQDIFQIDLPPPDTETAEFDAALVLDFSPHIHPLALFDQLVHRLTADAVVVLQGAKFVDESPRMRNWLAHVAAIGARVGLSLQKSDAAVVAGSNFWVRILHKVASPRWQIRHVRPSDFEEIAALFHEVFGHPLSRELWRWKYANGGGNAVVAARNGNLIAHYGGMYRDVMLCGNPDWVFQICDVMVHPKERGVMTRNGPFLLTAATSAEIYGPLGFGFPNDRHAQLAEKVGVGKSMGQMAQVRWVPASSRVRFKTRVKAITRDSSDSQALVDDLWTDMAKDLRQGVVGFRDWAYLERRYFSHPHNQYDVLLVTSRLTAKPLGVLVLHRLETSCELMDVVAPLANFGDLIDQARRLTGLWDMKSVYCWITSNHVQRFLDCGGVAEELHISIPNSSWTNDPRAEIFKDRWWLMSGDTDFR
jgi:hypothetical protein